MQDPSMAPSDIIDDIDEEPKEVNEVEETVNAINRLTDLIKHYQGEVITASGNNDPENLSQAILKLGRLNSALGRHAAFAKYIARNAEHAYKAARDQKKLAAMESGESGTKAETRRYTQTGMEHEAWSEAQLIADQADDLCFRTDTFLKMSQSRLSLIKGDAARG